MDNQIRMWMKKFISSNRLRIWKIIKEDYGLGNKDRKNLSTRVGRLIAKKVLLIFNSF